MRGVWAIGAVPLRCMWQGVEQTIEVAGWIKGPFGMDFRAFQDDEGEFSDPGFVLTHLATGRVVRQLIIGSISEAQHLADEILAGADWNFIEKPDATHSAVIKQVMSRHPGMVEAGHQCLAPRP